MCCGTAKSPCIEVNLHPDVEMHTDVEENCCGTAKSPCIEVEMHQDVEENCAETEEVPEDKTKEDE